MIRPGMIAANKRKGGGGGGAIPDSAVVALFGFEDATGTNWQLDESGAGNDITTGGTSGGRATNTAAFGSASFGRLSTGTSSFAQIPHSADFIFDGAFTVELWSYVASNPLSSAGTFVSKWGSSGQYSFGWHNTGSGHYEAVFSTDGTTIDLTLSSTDARVLSTWEHFCIERDESDVIRLYKNGVVQDSGTLAGTLFNNSSTTLQIGGWQGSGSAPSDARMDEVRITKGYARYGGAFTAPVAAFPRPSP